MKKKLLTLGVVIVLLAAAVCWFLMPRPVVADPANTVLTQIVIQCAPYYQTEADDQFVWMPQTEEEKALAAEIVEYLSTCQARRTFRTNSEEPPLSWKCMYLHLETSAPGSTFPTYRDILVGPTAMEEETFGREKDVNLSIPSGNPGFWDRFQSRLNDPDSIRTFVLEKMDLPEDFL